MFDIIGDVHGCAEELDTLLIRLGYIWDSDTGIFAHPGGRKAVFVGDLVDRGSDSAAVLSLVMNMTEEGQALIALGNHDDKLRRALNGNRVKIGRELARTISQLEERGNTFVGRVLAWLNKQPWKLVLDNDKLIVTHAGMSERLQERNDDAARSFALYGDTDGKTKDANGYYLRRDWAASYSGRRVVVHGHVPVLEPVIKNNVWNIDTSCCFGNKLTALRYPEMEFVQVEALEEYSSRSLSHD
jgi:protein phosphatase